MPQRYPVTALASIAPSSGQAFTVAGRRIALFNIAGIIHAMDDMCPHAGAPLSDGRLHGCVVTCPWHGWEFDVTNGRMPGQDQDCQTVYPVTINGDQIEVEV
ncbi:MAG: Rieske 2Fe-2S domain-containing protein [Opitutaceae bacterium]